MSKDVKLIRGQVRQVVQEVLPGLLNEEALQALTKKLTDEINLRLRHIESNVRDTLEAVDKRSKDSLSYLIRNATQSPTQLEEKPEDVKEDDAS